MAIAKTQPSAVVSAVIPVALRAELERRARAADRTVSSEVRRAVRQYLAADDPKQRAS